jgi:quercetin dioxygenase-like cupin family protein
VRESQGGHREPLVVLPDQGRKYDLGRMCAVFFADKEQTADRYSISEWSLEAHTEGPGAHSHPDDHIFCVLEGTLSLHIEDQRTEAPRGSYALIPGGVLHDFSNRGATACRFISINTPAGFELVMPQLVKWFRDNPLREIAAK